MVNTTSQKSVFGHLKQGRSIFVWKIIFLFQRLIPCRGAVKQLEKNTSLTLGRIIKLVEKAIISSLDSPCDVISGFISLGGRNNLGMLIHLNADTGKPLYVSKLANLDLIDREYKFHLWHKKYVSEKESVSPKMVVFGKICQSNICYLVTEYLHHSDEYAVEDVVNLYERISQLSDRIKHIEGVSEKAGVPAFKVLDNTKIKSVIAHIVTKLHTPDAFEYTFDYLNQRQVAFSNWAEVYDQLLSCVRDLSRLYGDVIPNQYYGLIHGDFKRQNILADDSGHLKSVDLQYYNYGASLWDLAFYFSKEKEYFTDTYRRLVKHVSLDQTESWIFLFLYIIASLLHVDKSNIKIVLNRKIRPALNILNETRK